VIASAVIPTVIANAFYLPRHLLPDAEPDRIGEPAATVPLRKVSRGAE
jgi:glutathione-regulated potassium-efflux system ancillary protein KefC